MGPSLLLSPLQPAAIDSLFYLRIEAALHFWSFKKENILKKSNLPFSSAVLFLAKVSRMLFASSPLFLFFLNLDEWADIKRGQF